ncbi:g275 [Coccomyxa elongata]
MMGPAVGGVGGGPFSQFAAAPFASSCFPGPPVAQQPSSTAAFSFRLWPLINALHNRFGADLALIQLWTLAQGQEWSALTKQQLRGVVARTDINPSAVQDPQLQTFRQKCCKQGIRGTAMGMVGKAWSTGCACVIQSVETLPHSLHPRTLLEGSESMADVVYIPIYDRLASKDAGVQGVLEVMVHRNATEPMVVASSITFVGALLGQLQMSLSRPPQQQLHSLGNSQQGAQVPCERHQQQPEQQRVMAPGAQAGCMGSPPKHERSQSPTSPLDAPPSDLRPWVSMQRTASMQRTTSMHNIGLSDGGESD